MDPSHPPTGAKLINMSSITPTFKRASPLPFQTIVGIKVLKRSKMRLYLPWIRTFRRKFTKSSHSHQRIIIANQINDDQHVGNEEENDTKMEDVQSLKLSNEDIAAIKIQALLRGFLARKAFRALRSLVKLQALVRGVQARRQSRLAMHCMHALVKLQVTIRTRQLVRIAGGE